jgi:hypothetical protein
MNATVAGLVTGLALGFAGYFGGFGAFIVVAAVGLAGLIVGYLVHGDVHVSDFVHAREGSGRRETFDRDRRRYDAGAAPRTEYRSRVR